MGFSKLKGWLKNHVKPLSAKERQTVVDEISLAASPGFDFFLLVVLSCSIATLGLITDSAAVIIGAMLLAPLMSPIIGIGLASISANSRLLSVSVSALIRGGMLAILLATITTLLNRSMPIISLQELPGEVLARTHPSPIDLVIALAGGVAAAYAMTRSNLSAALPGVALATALMPPLCTVGIGVALLRWDVAGGALLLFVTNAVTIAFSAVLVFFLRGFGRSPGGQEQRLPRSLLFSALLTMVLLIPLTYFSVQFFRDAAENRSIQAVVKAEVDRLGDTELVSMDITRSDELLTMVLTVRTNKQLNYQQVVTLQEAIVDGVKRPVSLKVNQVLAQKLDPLIPPTPTSTSTSTRTPTPGPSPTATDTPTLSPTPTASYTPTQHPSQTPTMTLPPAQAVILRTALPQMMIYQSPGGPVIGTLKLGQALTVLYRTEFLNGLLWVEVIDAEGRLGWVPGVYLRTVTPTRTGTSASTVSP